MDKLIFDIGLHIGEDTAFYLHQGYRVVAVDGNADMIEKARKTFRVAIDNGRLLLVEAVITKEERMSKVFYVSKNTTWSSLEKAIAIRKDQQVSARRVLSRTLASLISDFGVPYYVKIDLEGADLEALQGLSRASSYPRYISCETECLGKNDKNERFPLATLDALYSLGYRRFKLVDQGSLAVLTLKRFYSDRLYLFSSYVHRKQLSQKFGYVFPVGASGPFGSALPSLWLDYPRARDTLLFHRRDFFRDVHKKSYEFWCDWHATR